ncbi:MAG: hypothetical protein WCD47_19265 [Candidatus Sulfotelmatobacter sp.]
MPLDQTAIIKQIDDVLAKSNPKSPRNFDDFSDVPKEQLSEAINLLHSAIHRLAPAGSTYLKSAKLHEEYLTGNIGLALKSLRGTLRALRTDYDAGYLQSAVELIHADIFANFLEMAEYLIQQGYKDPAAVVTGSVLEAHLRKLCDKHGIPTVKADGKPKTVDALNSELASANIYSKLDQKSVTAWLDLRNKAAHGHYPEYTKEQVALMVQGVRDFVTRYPA